MIVGAVMTDHPSWRRCDDGAWFRAVRVGSSAWVLTATPVADGWRTTARPLAGASHDPVADVAWNLPGVFVRGSIRPPSARTCRRLYPNGHSTRGRRIRI